MFCLGHNFGSRHARRSSKSSIDAGDYVVSRKSLIQNFPHWIGVQGLSKLVKKNKNTPTFRDPPRRTPYPNQKIFFNRTKTTCCIRRGFEQLSSYSGWGVTTKKARANLLARAVVKGFVSHKYNSNSLAAVLHINKSNAAGNNKRLFTPDSRLLSWLIILLVTR